jgi:hypothetical protein
LSADEVFEGEGPRESAAQNGPAPRKGHYRRGRNFHLRVLPTLRTTSQATNPIILGTGLAVGVKNGLVESHSKGLAAISRAAHLAPPATPFGAVVKFRLWFAGGPTVPSTSVPNMPPFELRSAVMGDPTALGRHGNFPSP